MSDKCRTVGCDSGATERISYVMRGEPATDDTCGPCADSYGNRPALKEFTREPLPVAKAREIGAVQGRNAASWVFDGNTDRATFEHVLKGIEDGDPEVMDAYRVPDLSGEFADDYSEAALMSDVGGEPHGNGQDERADEITAAYEDGASVSFWDALESACRVQLSLDREAE